MIGFGDPAFFGDRYAHEYDEWTMLDPAPAVEFLAGLVPDGGRVLELAVGTGRVAIPLAERGIAVEGIEGSAKMVERMHAKPGGATIRAVIGDMPDVAVTYQRVRFDAQGTTLRPMRLRYCWPRGLDLMAQLAGMRLRERCNDWDRSPFTATSGRHVSVYERV